MKRQNSVDKDKTENQDQEQKANTEKLENIKEAKDEDRDQVGDNEENKENQSNKDGKDEEGMDDDDQYDVDPRQLKLIEAALEQHDKKKQAEKQVLEVKLFDLETSMRKLIIELVKPLQEKARNNSLTIGEVKQAGEATAKKITDVMTKLKQDSQLRGIVKDLQKVINTHGDEMTNQVKWIQTQISEVQSAMNLQKEHMIVLEQEKNIFVTVRNNLRQDIRNFEDLLLDFKSIFDKQMAEIKYDLSKRIDGLLKTNTELEANQEQTRAIIKNQTYHFTKLQSLIEVNKAAIQNLKNETAILPEMEKQLNETDQYLNRFLPIKVQNMIHDIVNPLVKDKTDKLNMYEQEMDIFRGLKDVALEPGEVPFNKQLYFLPDLASYADDLIADIEEEEKEKEEEEKRLQQEQEERDEFERQVKNMFNVDTATNQQMNKLADLLFENKVFKKKIEEMVDVSDTESSGSDSDSDSDSGSSSGSSSDSEKIEEKSQENSSQSDSSKALKKKSRDQMVSITQLDMNKPSVEESILTGDQNLSVSSIDRPKTGMFADEKQEAKNHESQMQIYRESQDSNIASPPQNPVKEHHKKHHHHHGHGHHHHHGEHKTAEQSKKDIFMSKDKMKSQHHASKDSSHPNASIQSSLHKKSSTLKDVSQDTGAHNKHVRIASNNVSETQSHVMGDSESGILSDPIEGVESNCKVIQETRKKGAEQKAKKQPKKKNAKKEKSQGDQGPPQKVEAVIPAKWVAQFGEMQESIKLMEDTIQTIDEKIALKEVEYQMMGPGSKANLDFDFEDRGTTPLEFEELTLEACDIRIKETEYQIKKIRKQFFDLEVTKLKQIEEARKKDVLAHKRTDAELRGELNKNLEQLEQLQAERILELKRLKKESMRATHDTDKVLEKFEGLQHQYKNLLDRFARNEGVLSVIFRFMRMSYALNYQDEVDKQEIFLMGQKGAAEQQVPYTQNPSPRKMSVSDTIGGGINTGLSTTENSLQDNMISNSVQKPMTSDQNLVGNLPNTPVYPAKTRNVNMPSLNMGSHAQSVMQTQDKNQILSFDQHCLSCSQTQGTSLNNIKLFKLACLSYTPSQVIFERKKYPRASLIELQGQVLMYCLQELKHVTQHNFEFKKASMDASTEADVESKVKESQKKIFSGYQKLQQPSIDTISLQQSSIDQYEQNYISIQKNQTHEMIQPPAKFIQGGVNPYRKHDQMHQKRSASRSKLQTSLIGVTDQLHFQDGLSHLAGQSKKGNNPPDTSRTDQHAMMSQTQYAPNIKNAFLKKTRYTTQNEMKLNTSKHDAFNTTKSREFDMSLSLGPQTPNYQRSTYVSNAHQLKNSDRKQNIFTAGASMQGKLPGLTLNPIDGKKLFLRDSLKGSVAGQQQ